MGFRSSAGTIKTRAPHYGPLLGIGARQEPGGGEGAERSRDGHHREGRAELGLCAEPSGRRVGDEPAGMRQRELRGEERRAVLCMR